MTTTLAIPASQIVSVNPGVVSAGGSALDLNGLILTTSTRVPIDTVQSFATAADVASFFGPGSQEASIAAVYFGGYDDSAALPAALLFTQYAELAAVAAYLRGGNVASMTLAQLQALTGTIIITIDGVAHTSASINLAAATSFSNAATLIQSGLGGAAAGVTGSITTTTLTVTAVSAGTVQIGQSVTGSGVTPGTRITGLISGTGGTGTYSVTPSQTASSTALSLGNALVTYDSVSGAFVITSGMTSGASSIGFSTGTLATPLKLTSATGAVLSQGSDIDTPIAFMTAVAQEAQDWATFSTAFEPVVGDKVLFAQWTDSTNDRFAYVMWDTDASPTVTVPATGSAGYLIGQADYSGTIAIYEPSDLNQSAFTCGWAASLLFTQTNGRTTLAFRKQSGITPGVTNATTANNLIANGYNFYGSYSTANDNFNFMYPGSISGPFKWADSYVNQIWLNNQLQLALMELLTNTPSIPYNPAGYGLIAAACNDPINAAVNFGAIRAGVILTSAQVAEINNAAGANVAPVVQSRGWYLQIKDPGGTVRVARGSPVITLWYADGESVNKINLSSLEVQ